MIDTTSLKEALIQLEKSMEFEASDLGKGNEDLQNALRAAAIKAFEFTYELSVKMIRRRLEAEADTPSEIDQMDFRSMFRVAAEKGLVDDPQAWFLFRDKRNITSHTYDPIKARDVLAVLPGFLVQAKDVLARLEAVHVPA